MRVRQREDGGLSFDFDPHEIDYQSFDGFGSVPPVTTTTGNQSRGIRNNNAGNIERTGTIWQGMAPDQTGDSRFVVFDSPEWGIRALGKTLLTYERKYGLNTIAKILSRWAPSSENNTQSYINAVSTQTGLGAHQIIDVRSQLERLVPAIIQHENGYQPYDIALIRKGINLI